MRIIQTNEIENLTILKLWLILKCWVIEYIVQLINKTGQEECFFKCFQ